jgi:hypothetical protein
MEARLRDGVAAGRSSTAGEDERAATWTLHYERAVRSYLAQLVGPDRCEQASERALAELAGAAGSAGERSVDIATIRSVARTVGLDELDAAARKLGRRAAQMIAGRIQCAAVARRLRDRADGRVAAGELEGFYRHIERCKGCGATAARFEASEWRLQVELESGKPEGSAGGSPRLAAVGTAEQLTWAPVGTADPGPGGRWSWRRRRGPIAAVGVIAVVVVVVAAVVLAGRGSSSPTRPAPAVAGASTGPGETATATGGGPATAGGPVSAHGTRTPFVLAGARFAVFANPKEPWTRFAKRVSAGPGMRWELVTVRVRNLTRTDLDPRALHYRLIAAAGVNYFPNLAYGTGPDVRRPPRPLAPQALVQAKLAFAVPVSATGLELAFDPAGRPQRVVVTLGT